MQKKFERIIHKTVHILEMAIAIITILVLVGLLVVEFHRMINNEGYFSDASIYMQNVLTIVVGLEFVRMLINMTPANTLEVLIVAISRQVIVNHNNWISNIACVVCIGGLFAIRRFLIPKSDMKEEISKVE